MLVHAANHTLCMDGLRSDPFFQVGTVGIAWGIYALSFSVKSVALLGSTAPVKFKVTKGGVTV